MGPQDRCAARRILVVDDYEDNAYLIKAVLDYQGYSVHVANDGVEAISKVTDIMPDLIILDVMMPRMDGFEVARVLRSRSECRAIPILMVTSLAEVNDKAEGLKAGADDYLCKPFSMTELLARVRSLLRIKELHDELQAKNQLLEYVLDHYVSKEVADEILRDPKKNLRLGGYSSVISVLFADIRGFTPFTEQHDASYVVEVLNRIFQRLSPMVFQYGGTLDKYLGDSIMAFFGAPNLSTNDPERAVRTAWAMQQQFERLAETMPELRTLGLGIGIATGEAVVGNIGSDQVMDYTVIGNTPNTASRLQERALTGEILIDEATWTAVKSHVEASAVGPIQLKGQSQPIQIYQVTSVTGTFLLEREGTPGLVHSPPVTTRIAKSDSA